MTSTDPPVRRAVGMTTAAFSTAVASALCCSGPVVLAAAGLSGAGLAQLRPLRPLFVFLSVGALWYGWELLARMERDACEPGRPCADPRVRRNLRRGLWVATVVSGVFLTSPWWVGWVVG